MLHARTGRANQLKHQLAPKVETITVDRLMSSEEAEVLEFLAQRPIHTVAMMSLAILRFRKKLD